MKAYGDRFPLAIMLNTRGLQPDTNITPCSFIGTAKRRNKHFFVRLVGALYVVNRFEYIIISVGVLSCVMMGVHKQALTGGQQNIILNLLTLGNWLCYYNIT